MITGTYQSADYYFILMLEGVSADKKYSDQLKFCQNTKSHMEEQQHNS